MNCFNSCGNPYLLLIGGAYLSWHYFLEYSFLFYFSLRKKRTPVSLCQSFDNSHDSNQDKYREQGERSHHVSAPRSQLPVNDVTELERLPRQYRQKKNRLYIQVVKKARLKKSRSVSWLLLAWGKTCTYCTPARFHGMMTSAEGIQPRGFSTQIELKWIDFEINDFWCVFSFLQVQTVSLS